MNRLANQLEFLKAVDALKTVERRTSILGNHRRENSAEHSWHMLLTAMTLAEHANQPIDLFKVLQMIALHELGEIGQGDTFLYNQSPEVSQAERESVKKLFTLLPDEQAKKYLELWDEFEGKQTPEAKFAAALDRLWPCIHNFHNGGGTWLEFKISLDRAIEKNRHIAQGAVELWHYVEELLNEADRSGLMHRAEGEE
jgi:putative hydrolase of HD superfamily